jgi:hypothetical protein
LPEIKKTTSLESYEFDFEEADAIINGINKEKEDDDPFGSASSGSSQIKV